MHSKRITEMMFKLAVGNRKKGLYFTAKPVNYNQQYLPIEYLHTYKESNQ